MNARPVIVAVALLAGCAAVGPDYERPQVEPPEGMPEAATVASDTIVRITSEQPWEKWWTVFKDPTLEQLIGDARAGNFDLRQAIARVHVARAQVREQFAPLFPAIGSTLSYTYQKFAPNAIVVQPSTGSASAPGGPSGTGVSTFSFTGQPFQLWAATADMSYELDLWGRLRRLLEASEGDESSIEEDKKNVEITALSDTANAYFDLGAAEANLAIANTAVQTRVESLDLVKGRVDAGLAPELDLRRAEAELARARADVPEFERQREVANHRLAILTGRMPDVKFDGRAPAEFDVPPAIPVGLPSTLLERRPDIRAAEMRIKAANARIGEAIAEFFPQVSLTGRFGYASIDIWKFAQPNSIIYAAGPSIRIPIFNGGATYARVLETEALTDATVAAYYGAIVNAFREVADALSGIAAHTRVRDREKEEVAASERALELATIEYDHGLTNYLTVLDAQRTLLSARQSLVAAQRQLLGDIVQLQKALGGGWTDVPADTMTPTKSGT